METKLNRFTIIVNEASLINNKLPDGNFQIRPSIQKKVGVVTENGSDFFVEMRAELHNTKENPFPIELVASVSGLFNIEGEDNEKVMQFLHTQGVQMVYPFLRTLVANLTSTAMMPSIMLPIIYVN